MSESTKHFQDKLDNETDSWDLSQALQAGEKIVVIDARSPEAFDAEHIPHAINLPHGEMNTATTADFDKDSLYVTYLRRDRL